MKALIRLRGYICSKTRFCMTQPNFTLQCTVGRSGLEVWNVLTLNRRCFNVVCLLDSFVSLVVVVKYFARILSVMLKDPAEPFIVLQLVWAWRFTALSTVKVMSSWSVSLLTLFLGRLILLSNLPVLVRTFSLVTDNCPFWFSGRGRTVEMIS